MCGARSTRKLKRENKVYSGTIPIIRVAKHFRFGGVRGVKCPDSEAEAHT